MRQNLSERERRIFELSQKNRWYQYEWDKKYLSPQSRETEVKKLVRNLKV